MPRSDDQIFAMLEKELRKDPNAATAFLKEKVAEIKKSVGKMSLRSFHGTYVGSVKRKISGRKGGRKKGATVKKAAGKVAKTATGAARSSGSLQDLLSSHLQSKRNALVAALDAAQSRALKSSDLPAIEAFGKKMDRMRKSLAE